MLRLEALLPSSLSAVGFGFNDLMTTQQPVGAVFDEACRWTFNGSTQMMCVVGFNDLTINLV